MNFKGAEKRKTDFAEENDVVINIFDMIESVGFFLLRTLISSLNFRVL